MSNLFVCLKFAWSSLLFFSFIIFLFVFLFLNLVFVLLLSFHFLFYYFSYSSEEQNSSWKCIRWLHLSLLTMWVNNNFETRDLTSEQKCHPSPDNFGETFAFNLIKQNETHFSLIFLTKKRFAVYLKNLNLNYYYQVLQVSPHYMNDDLSDKRCSSVFPPCLWLFFSLICSPTKQPYSKVDNSSMHRNRRNAVFISNFFFILMFYVVRFEWEIVLSSSYDMKQTEIHRVLSQRKSFYFSKKCLILSKGGAI